MSIGSWRPRSVREGLRSNDGPFDGVPPHLQPVLIHWLRRTFIRRVDYSEEWDYPLMMKVISGAELPLPPEVEEFTRINYLDDTRLFDVLVRYCLDDEERFLDVLDVTLHFTKAGSAKDLEEMLQFGGSAWRVAGDGKSLQKRVEESVQRAADEAIRPGGLVGTELRYAWTAAYGRAPNASDAWDHAIKAVEAVLTPIVLPNVRAGRVGQAIGQLRTQGHLYKLAMPFADDSTDVGVMVAMLNKLYPNPDRHANDRRREPTLSEAQAVLQLAVTLVQWTRDGILVRI